MCVEDDRCGAVLGSTMESWMLALAPDDEQKIRNKERVRSEEAAADKQAAASSLGGMQRMLRAPHLFVCMYGCGVDVTSNWCRTLDGLDTKPCSAACRYLSPGRNGEGYRPQ